MELVLSVQELETLPEPILFEKQLRPIGLLNSNYQKVVTQNLNNTTSQPIFGIKQRVKSRRYQSYPSIEAAIKVTFFVIIFLLIF